MDSGKCIEGCEKGFRNDNLCETCVQGKWGDQCLQTCSRHCRDKACHRGNGTCLHGCFTNFTGLNCTKCKYVLYGEIRQLSLFKPFSRYIVIV